MALQERVQILGRHTHRVRGTHAGGRAKPVRIIRAVSAGRSLYARTSFTKAGALQPHSPSRFYFGGRKNSNELNFLFFAMSFCFLH